MSDIFKQLRIFEKMLDRCMVRDRYGLNRGLAKIRKTLAEKGPDHQEKTGSDLAILEQKMSSSMDKREARRRGLPHVTFNESLPITLRKDEIIRSIRDHQVLILSGETGSGKTTQIPKFCLGAGRGLSGMIACTQPRRIAAMTVSARIAEELDLELGQAVGCKIRFQDKTSDNTLIKVMTDGVLLAEAQQDRFLNAYDTIIVDEAHERSLNIDFILGILRDLLKKRKDLKVIITSATIDTEKFSKAFDNAPIIEVSGRTYPVELVYRPALDPEEEDSFVDRAVQVVEEIKRLGPWGDILIFMPTEADIRECIELLEGRKYLNATVMPLYARLSGADQKAIFAPVPGRKIVVATNVAETSITIPGITYVVDTGLARIPRYTPRTRTTALPVMAISQSSADQRKGRCGRVENGVCFRLYSEKDFEGRPLFTSPEILRANLADVILRMIALRLGDVENFPFIDPPSSPSIRDGYDTLVELGAIRAEKHSGKKGKTSYTLTDKGRIMARIPVDPTLSRMLIEAGNRGCLEDMTVIIAALSIRDPRERPQDKIQQANQMHTLFKDPLSDFISYLNIWKRFHEESGGAKGAGPVKTFCKRYFLSFLRMREWLDIHGQLTRILEESFIKNQPGRNQSPQGKNETFSPAYQAIHQSILSGYLSGIALKKDKNIYTATRGREAMIFPGSGLFNTGGTWIVAAEMVETSRLFARNVANIDNAWLEELGGDCIVRTYSGAHWSPKKGAVFAREQMSLFGLVIGEKSVPYGKVNPAEATRLFIQGALVEGEVTLERLGKEWDFLRHNMGLIEEVKSLEDRLRRRDMLVSDDILREFYETRLHHVYDSRTLTRMIKDKGGNDFLKLTKDIITCYSLDLESAKQFPEQVAINDRFFSLSYCFAPGKEEDGITLNVPAGAMGAVSPEKLDWMVPGMIREKIESLLKNLPKEYRKKLVPISATVDRIMKESSELTMGKIPDQPLSTVLGKFIHQHLGIDIPASAWTADGVPPHLLMRVAILDAKGKVLTQGRDPNILCRDFSIQAGDDGFLQAKTRWEKESVLPWDCGDIPESVSLDGQGAVKGLAFPGLSVEKNAVALRLFRTRNLAEKSHKQGVRALFEKHLSSHLKSLKKDLTLTGQHRLYANYFGGDSLLNRSLYQRALSELFSVNIRSKETFFDHALKTRPKLHAFGQELYTITLLILDAFHQARSLIYSRELKEAPKGSIPDVAIDLRRELASLVPPSFIELYDMGRLRHLSRFIQGIGIRAQRAFENPDKDRSKAKEVQPYMDMLKGFVNDLKPTDSDEKKDRIEDFFWLIEEYKISVFAQELKTPVKISGKRLAAVAGDIRRMA
ncbi:MAG: ATP-dependent RNA helicase HrpA [Proteobacteria bacterium]|nr:ATP-dependent RNA helicase HrpA [Pseudomonadota bacterium]